MKKILIFLFFGFILGLLLSPPLLSAQQDMKQWEFQSVDTMKLSRDLAREKGKSPAFDQAIEEEMMRIADTGATYVAIATPYDEEFLPYLNRFVKAARAQKLHIWFRGNFAGWEKWFSYPAITRTQHMQKTKAFILNNPDLFEDGDIFTACPECENGGPGDPRQTKDVKGHRLFLINEYKLTKDAFSSMGKDVKSNYNSMNGDVARLIMDRQTTAALDGVVVIDHYVARPEDLKKDIDFFARRTGGRVVLGEIGAPVPDIHGTMTQEEQAQWLSEALKALSHTDSLIGLNYWVGSGGSTQLWDSTGKKRMAADVLSTFYRGKAVQITVVDKNSTPLSGVSIRGLLSPLSTDKKGIVQVPYSLGVKKLIISKKGYYSQTIELPDSKDQMQVVLDEEKKGLIERIKILFNKVIHVRINLTIDF